ncbi:OmpA family protein [Actinomyces sp.]|uniref:OmpA family protein n=1 Tax=Actinomyces sp. TaxID=29317 RepID=UPI002898E5ED|nr:OmpA family protein [Actinomyces sp.]
MTRRPTSDPHAAPSAARLAALLAGAALALGACTGGGQSSGEQSGQSGQSGPSQSGAADEGGTEAPAAGDLFVEGTIETPTSEVTARIGPLVNRGDHAVLVLEVELPDGAQAAGFERRDHWMAHPFRGIYRFPLLDLEAGTVEEPVRLGADPKASDEATLEISPFSQEPPYVAYSVYGPQDRDAVDVLVPSVGLVEDVPVVEESALPTDATDIRSVAALDSAEEEIGLPGQEINLRTAELQSFALATDDGQDIEVTPERVDINVNSDVLFDVDQDTLGSGAQAELQQVAAQLGGIEGGTITIVGHTDDVSTDEYNQALSERRAEAVRDALDDLADLSAFEVTTQGRGESEPRVAGTTSEARAANRRVEILVVPADTSGHVVIQGDDEAQLPEAEGPVGVAGEGATVSNDDGDTVRIDLTELRTRGRYLVGEVTVTNVGDTTDIGVLNALRAMTLSTPRGEFEPNQMSMPAGLTLLEGGQRFFPVDYSIAGADHTPVVPDQTATLEPGQSLVVPVVWPRMEADSAVLDVSDYKDVLGGMTAHYFLFRVTDIPIH